ncbi:general transcription factor 3C polypeptide 1 [Myripristis murdjan]|uniref:general transcription factor 3C polypeptide 1 n=1 Tax=Myripristis murdjan TaxID=586833 RepID=UPI001176354E|nr:general transcription factor 3C polypeptide 1 [Myripristis murdjan]
MDALGIVEDEVALEGLDGITIPSLWIRLEDRHPAFPLKLDTHTKEFIWRSLTSNGDLKFYELPQERGDVVLFDRFLEVDPETGIQQAERLSASTNDVYPVSVITEDKNGIQGSCVFYKERKDVTRNVRNSTLKSLVTLEEAFKRFGRKLVVVASQATRFRALVGPEGDPELKLSDHSYCILERLGRARWQGELQRDLHTFSFKTDAGKLHYMRKSLVRHGLITMQSHVIRTPSGQQQHSILLLLNRFHVNRRSKYDILMENMSNILQKTPGQVAPMLTLKELLKVNEKTLKRIYQYMQSANLVQLVRCALEDVNPTAEPCTTKKGTKVLVRCLKLVKPYKKKVIMVEDDEDDDEEDEIGVRRKSLPSEGRIMERDILLQAYDIIVACGTRGISQTALAMRMSIGKLESRMICRKLERDGIIKGFMEDVGRQRTTKFISHKCVGVSDHLQQFAKERERNKLLCSSASSKVAPRNTKTSPATPKTPSASRSKSEASAEPLAVMDTPEESGEVEEDGNEMGQMCSDGEQDKGDVGRVKKGKSGARKKSANKDRVTTKRTKAEISITDQTTPIKCKTPARGRSRTNKKSESVAGAEQIDIQEFEESISSPDIPSHPTKATNSDSDKTGNSIMVVEDTPNEMDSPDNKCAKSSSRMHQRHETYRLLKRKNMIVEAVHSLKIIEGLYPLQKMINEEERQDGVSTKCCKKSILRLIRSLSREGMVKLYTTTVIQDGITKKVEMVVHPSIQPNDDAVKRAIDQIRFRISSSYPVARMQQAEEKANEKGNELKGNTGSTNKGQKSKTDKKRVGSKEQEDFKPITVKGLSRTLGFQPKMHRLRVIHNFLWYLIYGHPLKRSSPGSQTLTDTNPGSLEKPSNPSNSGPDKDVHNTKNTEKQTQSSKNPASSTADQQTAAPSPPDEMTSGDEEEEFIDLDGSGPNHSDLKVFVDEETWKRFIPPIPIHKDFGDGWALVSDLLLCLPLSLFIQVIQVNFKIDGLEAFLSDPVKQHYLVRALPSKIKRQLLYKRKYIFTFHENLQKLAYMGLLQFGPIEKFQDKDQVFVYLRQNTTIVDTTSSEPHYWMVSQSPDKPFEKRQYVLASSEDVENYWFDLLCVCLNTPLGIIRGKRGAPEDAEPRMFPVVTERLNFVGMADLLKGSREVCDDGSIPGDGRGAGGLHSEFFAHLKRNWLWTNSLLAVKKNHCGEEVINSKIRLKNLLSKNALRLAIKAGGSTAPHYVTTKRPLITEENVEVAIEPASRNQQVVGGKRQKRKRGKKDVVKIPRKKRKEPKKRTPAHDEADHRALTRMTRQRVYWSLQEDSLMMLCSVASHLLNSKLKRPFIPHCVVRDLLQAEFEKSMDKTSVAVGRRTRYILKNPQTLLNYRICLAEVYQDKSLMKLLEQKKPANPDKPEDCAEAFSEYTKLLRQKFSSAMTPSDIIIPDTKQELFSRFKVCTICSGREMTFKDILNSTEDIHVIVLNNLIQSTLGMSNSQMKSSRSFQTFHMYSRYCQEVLCQVFIQCRKRGLVNRRRVCKIYGPKKNRALPILPMSYQLSQSYYRCFAWRFPFALCTDVFRFLRSLINNGTGDDKPLTTFYHETESRMDERQEVVEKGADSEQGGAQEKGDKGKGDREEMRMNNRLNKDCEVREADRQMGEPERHSENGNNSLTVEGENNESKGEGEQMELGLNNDTAEPVSKTESLNQQVNPEDSSTLSFSEEPSTREQTEEPAGVCPAMNPAPAASEELSDMLRYQLDSPGGACAAALSLMTLGLLSVHVSIPKQVVVVDSNLVDNEVVKSMAALEEEEDDDDDTEDCEGRKRLEVKAHQASHTNYLMMRGYCCPGIVKLRNLNTSDSIVVESCIMKFQLRSTPAHQVFNMDDSPPLDLSKCGPSLLPPILTHSVRPPTSSPSLSHVEECNARLIHQRDYSPQDIEACAELRRSLDEAGENGLSVQDLYEAHTHLAELHSGRTRSLQQYMQDLKEEGEVLEVGGLGVRWVLMHRAGPWLLTTNSKPWSQSRLSQDGLLPMWENQHNIPFMRKRHIEGGEDEEAPPSKKVAKDKEGDKAGEGEEGLSSKALGEEAPNSREELSEQREGGNETSGENLLNSGEEKVKETLPEEKQEEAAETKNETQEKGKGLKEVEGEQTDIEHRTEEGDDATCSPPARAANTEDEHTVSFISRPWRMVDGQLNRPVCKGMLEGVLYHIMSRPGLTQQTLVEHYKNVLQPVVVLDLVQALIDMGCVKKRTLVPCPKPSLFSRPVDQAGVRTATPDRVFYEPTVSCCLRLAQVLPNEPHWNQFIQ